MSDRIPSADSTASRPERSAAYRIYERNLDTVDLVIELFRLRLRAFKERIVPIDSSRITTAVEALRLRGANAKEDAIRLLTEAQAEMARFQTDLQKEVASIDEARQTLSRCIAVMLVTFVETYLQDVMSEVARNEPAIMNNTQQASEYEDVINSANIAELAEELRSRCARRFTDDGGPAKWASRLAKRGAGEYDRDAVATMERLWGVRHVVIHNAG